MKIGIYARGLSEYSSGPKIYIEEIIKNSINLISKNDELYIFHNSERKIFKNKKNVKEIIINNTNKLFCDLILSPKIINSHNLDVCLFPKGTIPFFINCKKLLTVLDLGYYRPEFNAYKLLDNLYMRFMIKSSCKRADKIIAISKSTKNELINILKMNPNKISVIYLASSDFSKKEYKKSKEKYIFYAGSISPRKNLIRLINAFEKLNNKELFLYITGNKMWNNKTEMQMIKNNPKIKVLGLVSKEKLKELYNTALVYVYPSLYEGFGLPILEAQACGCPVITSNVSSMPEVAGKGAILVDPYTVNEISNAIKIILNNKKLKEELVKKGFENCKKFSWEKCAKETLEACNDLNNERLSKN